ncbi:hypothetical protein KCTC52924_02969 [Arenibacter antarcticus]|uniref:O-antigen ligase like membrane protein n=1 Tax=Arenibacter antarcticus TaxID=2040469 RepID=A0ABW5VJ54_9FLAO|nr:hypothetical protein [Arenibacter sp. H213]MCM4167387.1 hypothetical protein [Arenibacter sp. H213]
MKKIRNILILNIFIVYCFLSPTSEVFYFLGYLGLLVNIGSLPKLINYNLNLKLILGLLILMSFLFNINYDNSFKDYLNAFNILLLLFLFPYFISKDLKIHIFSIITIITVILFSQLAFIFDISIIKGVILTIYNDESSEFGFDRFINTGRNGGIYYNPNQASKYLTILLALSLVVIKNNKLDFLIILSILLGIFLTGSRTGMLVALIIIACNIFIVQRKYIYGVTLTLCGLLISIIITPIADSRSFQISNSGSIQYKLDIFFEYINNVIKKDSLINLTFGNFTSDYNSLMTKFEFIQTSHFGFDSEFGMAISFLGVSFWFTLLIFYYRQLLLLLKSKFILIFIPFIFWPITSTVLFSFKTSLVYMVLLGFGVSIVKNGLRGNFYK